MADSDRVYKEYDEEKTEAWELFQDGSISSDSYEDMIEEIDRRYCDWYPYFF